MKRAKLQNIDLDKIIDIDIDGLMLDTNEGIESLREQITAFPAMNLLVVDTLGSVSTGDENDAKKGTMVIQNLTDLAQSMDRDFGVLCVGHTCKGGQHGGWHSNQGKMISVPKVAQLRGTGGQVAMCRAAHSVTFAGGDPEHKNKRIFFNVRNSFRLEGLADPICFEKDEEGIIKECKMVPFYQPNATPDEADEVQKPPTARMLDHWLHAVLATPLEPSKLQTFMKEHAS